MVLATTVKVASKPVTRSILETGQFLQKSELFELKVEKNNKCR